jgi:hypothetical protein
MDDECAGKHEELLDQLRTSPRHQLTRSRDLDFDEDSSKRTLSFNDEPRTEKTTGSTDGGNPSAVAALEIRTPVKRKELVHSLPGAKESLEKDFALRQISPYSSPGSATSGTDDEDLENDHEAHDTWGCSPRSKGGKKDQGCKGLPICLLM